MTDNHQRLLRALAAAQLAVFEHLDENIGTSGAKQAILKCLKEAERLAKTLDD